MVAWLIINDFLLTEKFKDIYFCLPQSGKRFGVHMLLKTNAELMVNLGQFNIWGGEADRPDFIVFWDKDVRLAKYLEELGFRVFNGANAIAVCDDKSLTYMELMKAGIKIPKTILAPMTYVGVGYTNLHFLDNLEYQISYPMILKENFGSFGHQVYFIPDRRKLEEKLNELGGIPLIFQEFIETSFARDIRLQVVGNNVVASMYRYSETGDFRANITNGGKMIAFEPTKEQCDLSIQCCKIIGLDFAGVDLLFGEKDEPIVCEVNSNAHFKNIHECTGVNVADAIMKHIVYNIKKAM